VANALRDQIISGNYKTGDWLPTERALAQNLGVNRQVIRKAINRLAESGFIIHRPNCRPIVGVTGLCPVREPERNKLPGAASSNFIALIMWSSDLAAGQATASQQQIFWGVNQALAKAGHHAILIDLGIPASEAENAAREAGKLRYLFDLGISGAIFYPGATQSKSALIREAGDKIPFVTIDRHIESANADFIDLDNRRPMCEITNHLIARGHRRIAYITRNESCRAVQDRIQGYIDGMREAGLEDLVLSIPSCGQEWTAIDAVFQLPKGKRPTAAAVFNDRSAIELWRRLEQSGLSVPEDVALTGFGDSIPAAPLRIELTTTEQPYEEMGRTAADLLMRRLQKPSAPRKSVELTPRLIVRESCRAPDSS